MHTYSGKYFNTYLYCRNITYSYVYGIQLKVLTWGFSPLKLQLTTQFEEGKAIYVLLKVFWKSLTNPSTFMHRSVLLSNR